jgi:RNA polymerase sigma factor (sigma-70 family)
LTATHFDVSDRDLVAAIRAGDDAAFEELYRRYRAPIAAYVGRIVRDSARAEDLAQDAFFSALRHLRATDSDIDFKPWIYEIARNATIDDWRRTSQATEVSVDHDGGLRPSDRIRLVGAAAPDSVLVDKERLTHLQGAFDELGDVQARALVMRELEGMSYREIAETLDVSRSTVETTLLQARRRLEIEYADISEGRRCESVRAATTRLALGTGTPRDEGRLSRHARRCPACRRHARELGVEPLPFSTRLRRKVASLLPFPLLEPAAERTAAIVAAIVIAGTGGAMIAGVDIVPGAILKEDSQTKPAGDEGQGNSGSKSGAGEASPAAKRESAARRRQQALERRRAARRRELRGNGGARKGADNSPNGSGPAGSSGGGQGGGQGGGGLPGGRDLPGVGDLPGVPNLPETPNLPNVPNLPNTPDLPNVPNTPNLPAPNLPSTPNLPATPNLPSTPSTPQLPSTPSLPVQPPSLPQPPALPQAPVQTPSLP